MTTQYLQDPETKENIPFEWNKPTPPTSADINALFTVVKSKKPSVSPPPKSTSQKMEDTFNQYFPSAKSDTGALLPLGSGLVGGVAKTIGGRTGLSALLAAGGEGYHQIVQHIMGDSKAPQTSIEAIERMGKEGAMMGGGQLAGEGITAGLGKIIPKVKKEYLIPGLQKAEETLRPYMEKYLPKSMQATAETIEGAPAFTVAQKAEPFSAAAKMENIIEHSFFGAAPIKAFRDAQQKGITDYAKDVTNGIWAGIEKMPPSQQGEAFTKAFDAAHDAFKSKAKVLYDQVDKLAGDAPVTTYFIKKSAIKEATRTAQFGGIGSSEMGDKLLTQVSGLPNKMTFNDAAELRSRLIKTMWQSEKKDVARGLASRMIGEVDSAMEKTATKLSPDTQKAWRVANDFYKQGKGTFENEFIRGLVSKAKDSGQPELIGKALFQNGEISQIQMAKKVLANDPKTWQSMKAGYLENVFSKATDTQTGVISGKQIANFLSEKGMGTETLKEIFNPSELATIKTFSKALNTVETKSPAGGGSMLIQLMQAPALASAITLYGGFKKDPEIIAGGLALLVTPNILGKMLVSPTYQKLFIQGLSANKAIAMPAIVKLATGAIDISNQTKGKKPETTNEPEARQEGGNVQAGQSYLVGEQGAEKMVIQNGQQTVVGAGGQQVIVPQQDGVIIPNPDTVLSDVLKEYPGLSKVFNTDNTKVMFASPERTAAKQKYGSKGGLEYWDSKEDGVAGYKHPNGGKSNVLEIYDPNLQNNPQALKNAIYGDLLHGMDADPTYKKLRDDFASSFTPAEKKRIESKQSWWEDANGAGWGKKPTIDAYIRGWLNDQGSAMEGQKATKGSMYSQKQLFILQKIKNYLKSSGDSQ